MKAAAISLAKLSLLALTPLLMLFATPARAESYEIDSRHTFPVFEVSHHGFSIQRGRFNKVSGKLEIDQDQQRGSVDVTIDVNSIDMGFENWNEHMRGEKYFHTEQHPQARFHAKNFSISQDVPFTVTGELTLLGVTRQVSLEVSQWRCAKHPFLPRRLCGADLSTNIKRSDFGMTQGLPGIGDSVRILIPVEAISTS